MIVAFLILAALTVASALAVVAMSNPIHSALCLIVNLLGVAALFAVLDAHFLSTVQIIVYAGAIVVLVLFVLMLLNIKVEVPSRQQRFFNTAAVLVGLSFAALAVPTLLDTWAVFPTPDVPVQGTVKAIGQLLYSKYVFTFEAASLLIMAAVAGAVMLAKKRTL